MKTLFFILIFFSGQVWSIATDIRQLKLRDSHLIFDDKLESREIAITFSGNINPEILKKILSILDSESIRAHFFLTGDSAIQYPELVYSLFTKNHVVGSQGLSTPASDELSTGTQAINAEIQTGHELVYSAVGAIYPFIRLAPRQGALGTREMIKASGAFAFYWNIDYYPENPDQSMRDNLKRENYRGIVALPLNKQSSLIALSALIEEIKNEDLTVVTIVPNQESVLLTNPPLIRKSVQEDVKNNGSIFYRKLKEKGYEI